MIRFFLTLFIWSNVHDAVHVEQFIVRIAIMEVKPVPNVMAMGVFDVAVAVALVR